MALYTRSNIEIGREEKEQRRNKRKNHTHALPIRESINEDNFVFILDLVKGNNLIAARKKSAIILLYLTGLNVSSLTLFTVRNRTELLEKGATTIPLIIGGKPKVYIKFCDKGRELFKKSHTFFCRQTKGYSMPTSM